VNRHAIIVTLRPVHREPGRAARLDLLFGSARRMTTRAARAKRNAIQLTEPLKRAATDPKVHAETRRARADALRAARRARRVGATNALSDKHVSRGLRHATRHASRAAHLAVHPRRRHAVRTTTATLLGTGMLAAAAYGGWKTHSPRSASTTGRRIRGWSGA
jgi:hypothetical protein